MENTTSTPPDGRESDFASPVSVLPLFILVGVILAVLIVICVLYRRRKQKRLERQLRLTEKRIDVLGEDLDKARENMKMKEVDSISVAGHTAEKPQQRQSSFMEGETTCNNDRFLTLNKVQYPAQQHTFHSYKTALGPHPIHSSFSTITDGTLPGQTSIEVQYGTTPTFKSERYPRQIQYRGLSAHYSVVGSSAEAFVRSYNPHPLQRTYTLPHGYQPPYNTPDDSQEIQSASHRTTCGTLKSFSTISITPVSRHDITPDITTRMYQHSDEYSGVSNDIRYETSDGGQEEQWV